MFPLSVSHLESNSNDLITLKKVSFSSFLIVSHFNFEKLRNTNSRRRINIIYIYTKGCFSLFGEYGYIYLGFFREKLRNWIKKSMCLVFLIRKTQMRNMRNKKHSSDKHFAFSEVTV